VRAIARLATLIAAVLLLAGCWAGDESGGGSPPQLPQAPSGVTVHASSATSVHVMWNRASGGEDVTGYAVYRDGAKAKDVPAEQHMVDITGLEPSARYEFAVRAVGASGNLSPPSAAAPVTTLSAATADAKAPTRPTKLRGRAEGAHAATLTWSKSADNLKVTSYDIYQGDAKIHSVGGGETSALVTTLQPDTDYLFTVKARDAADNVSPASNAVRLTTATGSGSGQAAAPAGLEVKTRVEAGRQHLHLTWAAPKTGGEVTEYQVYVNGKFSTTLVLGASAPKDRAEISLPVDEKPGVTYTVKVRARLPDGNWGAFSAQAAVTTAR
jgi:chitodextrinase